MLFRAGATAARRVPEPLADGLARLAAMGVARRRGPRRAQVERNLRRVHGPHFEGRELERAVSATFVSYARYWVESFRLPGVDPATLDARMSYVGADHIEAGLDAGKGVILALPHLGCWEWAGFWVAEIMGRPLTVVVEALEPPELFEWFADLRRSLGMNVVALDRDAGREVIKALEANHVVCLLCDRDLGGGGVEVEFFGEVTRLPAGPATMALRTGAPVLPTAVYLRGRSHHAVVRPPVSATREGRARDDIGRMTQQLAFELESLIRAAPEQWHLLQPNWPSDPGYVPSPGPPALPSATADGGPGTPVPTSD